MAVTLGVSHGPAMVTLFDSSQVPRDLFDYVCWQVEKLNRINQFALRDLLEKCKDSKYKFIATKTFGDSERLLRESCLLKPGTGAVEEAVRTIVLSLIFGAVYAQSEAVKEEKAGEIETTTGNTDPDDELPQRCAQILQQLDR